jgi:hypothetical protein
VTGQASSKRAAILRRTSYVAGLCGTYAIFKSAL